MNNDNFVVRVKAQVMTRDDSTGGWVPMGGGGLSIVGLRKMTIAVNGNKDTRIQYHIFGKKIVDESVVLDCVLKKDVEYNNTPTFHHWKTEDKRFGLTFQSAADARAFLRGVRQALEDLTKASYCDLDHGDDNHDVFMAITLPLERELSSSGSSHSGGTLGVVPPPRPHSSSPSHTGDCCGDFVSIGHNGHQHLLYKNAPLRTADHSIKMLPLVPLEKDDIWVKQEALNKYKSDQGIMLDSQMSISDSYSYVQLQKKASLHEYSYPSIDMKPDSAGSRVKSTDDVITTQPPLLPTKGKKQKQDKGKPLSSRRRPPQRCRHCSQMYNPEENTRGACSEAPDCCDDCVNAVSCMVCGRCMVYHCISEQDDDRIEPCSCDTVDSQCCKRWAALTVLSLIVPCLWCYLPLSACRKCVMHCGFCGGQHKAVYT